MGLVSSLFAQGLNSSLLDILVTKKTKQKLNTSHGGTYLHTEHLSEVSHLVLQFFSL